MKEIAKRAGLSVMTVSRVLSQKSCSAETKKKVEDTCRSMISTYNSDKLIYEQYKDSDNAEKASWAEQAKMRANKTASSYNNYVLKNKYVWKKAPQPRRFFHIVQFWIYFQFIKNRSLRKLCSCTERR